MFERLKRWWVGREDTREGWYPAEQPYEVVVHLVDGTSRMVFFDKDWHYRLFYEHEVKTAKWRAINNAEVFRKSGYYSELHKVYVEMHPAHRIDHIEVRPHEQERDD